VIQQGCVQSEGKEGKHQKKSVAGRLVCTLSGEKKQAVSNKIANTWS